MPVKGGKDRHPYPAREADNRGSDGMVRFSLPSESVKFSRLPLKSALVPTEMLSADPLCDFLIPWAKSNHLLLSLRSNERKDVAANKPSICVSLYLSA